MEPITLVLLLLAVVISFVGVAVLGLHDAALGPKERSAEANRIAKARVQSLLDLNTQH